MASGSGVKRSMTTPRRRTLAVECYQTAQRCQEVVAFLGTQCSSLFWQCQAPASFKEHLAESMSKVRQLRSDFSELGQEIERRAAAFERAGGI
ncbi:MAG TPA: hypothetical protein VJ183_13395 [Chloroflexia bacterium]|nr:hypothetical protein [Chloroflexia bacterium]